MTLNRKLKTADGSFTFFNKNVGETYHSVTGAFEEAFAKFIMPAEIERFSSRPFVVFDICFGLGYNTAAALHSFLEHSTEKGFMELYGFEIDKWILDKASGIKVPDYIEPEYAAVRTLIKSGTLFSENCHLCLIKGDVRKTLVHVRADVVLFGPFSPKRAPELWQPGFIAEIRRHMNIGGVLTTFSCARSFRDALKANGFEVSDGPMIGRRGPSTVAKVFK